MPIKYPGRFLPSALQRKRQTRSVPSPLVGEGWGGGWCSETPVAPPANHCATPTPNPSPQGGGEEAVVRAVCHLHRRHFCRRRDDRLRTIAIATAHDHRLRRGRRRCAL